MAKNETDWVGGQVGRKKVHETGSGLAELGTNGITHRHTQGASGCAERENTERTPTERAEW